MKSRIIRIGNSQGISIPKVFIEQSSLGEEIELEVLDMQIVIRAAERPRQGWDEAFRSMAEHEGDRLLDEDLSAQTHWDEDEWQW